LDATIINILNEIFMGLYKLIQKLKQGGMVKNIPETSEYEE
jgi:hypothetical protein